MKIYVLMENSMTTNKGTKSRDLPIKVSTKKIDLRGKILTPNKWYSVHEFEIKDKQETINIDLGD